MKVTRILDYFDYSSDIVYVCHDGCYAFMFIVITRPIEFLADKKNTSVKRVFESSSTDITSLLEQLR